MGPFWIKLIGIYSCCVLKTKAEGLPSSMNSCTACLYLSGDLWIVKIQKIITRQTLIAVEDVDSAECIIEYGHLSAHPRAAVIYIRFSGSRSQVNLS